MLGGGIARKILMELLCEADGTPCNLASGGLLDALVSIEEILRWSQLIDIPIHDTEDTVHRLANNSKYEVVGIRVNRLVCRADE